MEANYDHSTSIPQETTSWLLSSQTSSIRYLTLTELLHQPPDDPEIRSLRTSISISKPVTDIFSRQDTAGFWVSDRHFYSPKYRSSHWTMYLLTELAVPPDYPAMQLGAEFMIKRMEANVDRHFREEAIGLYCFWGNWLRYQLYCGNIDQPKVQRIIAYTCKDIQRKGQCKYNGDLPCAWSVIRGLSGLALIPANLRSAEIDKAIAYGIEFILEKNKLLSGDYPHDFKVHELWGKISFPLFYHTDILFVLRVLQDLDALKHPKAQPAIEWLRKKQTSAGIWRGGSPFRSRTRPFLVKPDTPSHWITLQAAGILAAADKQTG